LTASDLRQLETRVPLDTLKTVVDLALEIGREGREGKPVGTLFVVGDTRKVLGSSRPTGFSSSSRERKYNNKNKLSEPRFVTYSLDLYCNIYVSSCSRRKLQ
jgi:DNA integrity scanning protein DisA with diadenylate cyclase activity